MEIRRNLKEIFILCLLSYLFFMFGNGLINLTNPDEVFYMQTAKEMSKHNTWLVPYLFDQPQFEKPIMLYWFLRIAIILFGISNFGARFFPALFATIGVLCIYFFNLYAFQERKKAFLSALVLTSCGLYVGMARTVFTDMPFSVFILFSLETFYLSYLGKIDKKGIVLSFVFSALAVLTKGPLGFIIPFLIVTLFLGIRKELKFIFCKHFLLGFIFFFFICLPWYIFMLKKFGSSFVREFFYNDHIRRLFEAEHSGNDHWYFYPAYLFISIFPWSIFGISSIFYTLKYIRDRKQPICLFSFLWISVVMLLFQIAHSKLTSYILPLLPPMAIITGNFLYDSTKEERRRPMFIASLVSLSLFLAVPIGLIPVSFKYSRYLSSRIPVYGLAISLLVLLCVTLYFILKNRFFISFYLIASQLILMLCFILFNHRVFDDYVSNKGACEYLRKNYNINNTIVCSKMFVRGVRYYMDKEIAVMGSNFFSPHPIPCLDDYDKIKNFLQQQKVTYLIVNRSDMNNIMGIVKGGVKLETLQEVADAIILKISE